MGISSGENLTKELERLGIPNPFAELRLTRAENFRLFGRAYLGRMTVSDIVTTPHGQELYAACADEDEATTLTFDQTGERSERPAPPADYIYAIVQSPNDSLFWNRLEAAIELKVEVNDKGSFLLHTDEFIATYGIPAGAKEHQGNDYG